MKDIGGGRQDGRGKEAHTGRHTGWKVGRGTRGKSKAVREEGANDGKTAGMTETRGERTEGIKDTASIKGYGGGRGDTNGDEGTEDGTERTCSFPCLLAPGLALAIRGLALGL